MNRSPGAEHQINEVWSWNFDPEFNELLAAVSACGEDAVVALDTEFPGFLREEKQSAKRSARYEALRQNCDNLRPIQLGISVANSDGELHGTWSFNLAFDVQMDLHTEESVAFLMAAGLDFPRHAREGIDPAKLGRWLAGSTLVGQRGSKPRWVTFQGLYDFGYILRLITNWHLPPDENSFDELRDAFFPVQYELRDELPRGSLDSLLRDFGIERHGQPHTAGSDALATLELYHEVARQGARIRYPSFSEASTAASSFHIGMEGAGGYLNDAGSTFGGSSGSSYSGYTSGSWPEDVSSAPLGLQALDELAGTGVGASGARFSSHACHTGLAEAQHAASLGSRALRGLPRSPEEWDEAVAAAALQEGLAAGGWEEAHGTFAEEDFGGHVGGHWEILNTSPTTQWKQAQARQQLHQAVLPAAMQAAPMRSMSPKSSAAQELAQAVLAAAGAGMAALEIQDPVQQQSQQQAAMQSMLMTGRAVTSTQPMESAGYGYSSGASMPRWQTVDSDGMWMDNTSSDMFYTMPGEHMHGMVGHHYVEQPRWPSLVHTLAG
eukprot:gb/GFBE01075908.1/.p1 GENE.gb/GFBE01075908.1/~~gb/GFBE01075908.1/.p1  ORF type:complete len:551 (+),score=112.64 gb/GFBE01075908.1/:1-1653(+)